MRKSDVKSFMPLKGCLYFGPDKRFVFMLPRDDSIHRMDAEFTVTSVITNGVSAIQRLDQMQGWRDMSFVLDVDSRFSGCANKALLYFNDSQWYKLSVTNIHTASFIGGESLG